MGPTEFARVPGSGQQGRPARQTAGGSTGTNAGSDDGVMGSDQCACLGGDLPTLRPHLGTDRSLSKGDPAAAQEMAAASRAVAAA